MKHACLISPVALIASWLISSSAFAQDTERELEEQADEEQAALDDTESDLDEIEDEDLDTREEQDELEQDTAEGQALDAPPPTTETEDEIREEEEPTFLLGVRYRMLVIPKFLINWFGVDGATDVVTHGIGPEFGFNHPDFEILLSGWYADYGMAETPFKGPNDGPEAWELVTSRLKQFYITADFLWKHHLTKNLDFHLGAGVGLGIVFGELDRWEATWVDGASTVDPGDPYTQLARCDGGDDPNSFECPADGDYGTGEPWPVFPWVTLQTGLRYSPIKQFVGRLDLGVGSSGFWVGLGADYGL